MGVKDYIRDGLGIIDMGVRYGYTDDSYWYLGECRVYDKGSDVSVKTYAELQKEVDDWIKSDPSRQTVALKDTSRGLYYRWDNIKLNQHFIANETRKPSGFDTTSANANAVYADSLTGLTGVGYGALSDEPATRWGRTDGKFWYKGEPRTLRIRALPAGAREVSIPASGPPAGSGVRYYEVGSDTYVTDAAGYIYQLLPYSKLVSLMDGMDAINRVRTIQFDKTRWYGFLWMGTQYWPTVGLPAVPDEFLAALNESERNLHTILRWMPVTAPLARTAPDITVSLPQLNQRQMSGDPLQTLLTLSLLNRSQSRSSTRRSKRRRGRRS